MNLRHAVGGRDGGTMALKGVFKERLLQIVSVATQVAISRRVQRHKLALRGRQVAEKRANKIDLEPINANDMGMESRRIVQRVFV
ncbi:unnamed protein product [Ectocarpus sp. CCAP 1310/34]|nr:unnamed protein product [Ectocarpus sp. CCAP 1310/34]